MAVAPCLALHRIPSELCHREGSEAVVPFSHAPYADCNNLDYRDRDGCRPRRLLSGPSLVRAIWGTIPASQWPRRRVGRNRRGRAPSIDRTVGASRHAHLRCRAAFRQRNGCASPIESAGRIRDPSRAIPASAGPGREDPLRRPGRHARQSGARVTLGHRGRHRDGRRMVPRLGVASGDQR